MIKDKLDVNILGDPKHPRHKLEMDDLILEMTRHMYNIVKQPAFLCNINPVYNDQGFKSLSVLFSFFPIKKGEKIK